MMLDLGGCSLLCNHCDQIPGRQRRQSLAGFEQSCCFARSSLTPMTRRIGCAPSQVAVLSISRSAQHAFRVAHGNQKAVSSRCTTGGMVKRERQCSGIVSIAGSTMRPALITACGASSPLPLCRSSWRRTDCGGKRRKAVAVVFTTVRTLATSSSGIAMVKSLMILAGGRRRKRFNPWGNPRLQQRMLRGRRWQTSIRQLSSA